MKKFYLCFMLLTIGLLVNAQQYWEENPAKISRVDVLALANHQYWEDGDFTWIYNKGASRQGQTAKHGNMVFGTSNWKRMEITRDGDIYLGIVNDLALKPNGRNADPTIRVMTDKWLRMSANRGIALWGNNNAEADDQPHVILTPNRTLTARYNFSVLTAAEDEGVGGGIHFKRGVSNNPTIRVTKDSWFRIGGKWGIYFWGNDNVESNNNPTLSILGDNVGIGTGPNRPEYKLDVRDGAIRVYKNNIQLMMNLNSAQTAGWIGTFSNHPLCLGANNGEAIFIDGSQRVYVGLNVATINNIKADLKNKYDLFVDRGILSEDYAIAPKSTWSDFVFSKEYTLPSLWHVENFIIENKHLPNVPSATQVAEEGYSQHEMNKTLLQKIEELTLYIIEQQKQINELQLQQGQFKK